MINYGDANRGRLSGLIASFALFVLLPAIITLVLGINAIDFEQRQAFAAARQDLETRLTQFACDVDNQIFLARIARGAWLSLRHSHKEPGRIKNYIDRLKKFFPCDFDIYLFGDDGRLITPEQVKLRSRYVSMRLWELIQADSEKQSELFKKIRKPVKSLLGEEFKVAQLLEKKDGLLQIMVKHQKGFVYWNRSRTVNKAGIIMVFWNLPELSYRIDLQKKRNNDFMNAFAEVADSHRIDFGRLPVAQDYSQEIKNRLVLMNQPFYLVDDVLWISRKLQDGWVAVAAKYSETFFRQMYLVLFFSIIMLVGIALIVSMKFRDLRLPIRFKLSVLFVTAIFMPLMGFLFLGYQYYSDREQTLIARIASTSRQRLFKLDESFSRVGEVYQPEMKRLLPVIATGDHRQIREALKPKVASNELVTVEVRDINGKVTFNQVNELFFEGMREVSEAFSRFCIDTALGTNLGDSVDPIISMVVKAPEGGMFFLFDRPGEIHPHQFGPVPLLIFWQIIDNLKAEKVYIFAVQSASILVRRLVKVRLKEIFKSPHEAPYITLALHNASGEWYPSRPVRNPYLIKFSERLKFTDKPLDTEMEINGRAYLLTGQKGKYARDYSFFTFFPKEIVDQDLSRIRKLLSLSMFAFLLVALLTGNILSNTFLEPIRQLSEGVLAIKRRDADFRIKTRQNDEFGDLSVSFNHMIEDLKEMQLARDVQESLLPSEFPPIKGYSVAFVNRMASDVGGDYFDLHKLDDERVCLLVGDVTGHGVSSALVMAMAKAIVYQSLKEQRSLVELFADLNLTIHTYFKIPPARKMITLFAAILHCESGEICCANAGHNFPVKVSGAGEIEEFSAVHLPIGATKKLRNLNLNYYQIAPCDTAVFYTDGLIEVKNKADEMYGYDQFKENLKAMANDSAQEILAGLVKCYDQWLGEAEPDDDLTIIVLKRDQTIV